MLATVIGLLVSHFIGDFLFQSDRMALNKARDRWVLLQHVFAYSMCFVWAGISFLLWTAVLHFITDAYTSKLTSRLWFVTMLSDPAMNEGRFVGRMEWRKRHWFFVAIGFDQLIHAVTLLLTAQLLGLLGR